MSEFKEMKFRVKSLEEYNNLQNYLFSLGYKWYYVAYVAYNKHIVFLYTNERGYITHFNNEEYFNKKEVPEYTLEQIIKYELKEVVKETLLLLWKRN